MICVERYRIAHASIPIAGQEHYRDGWSIYAKAQSNPNGRPRQPSEAFDFEGMVLAGIFRDRGR